MIPKPDNRSTAGSEILSAVAQPSRREILRLIWEQDRSAGEIARRFGDVTFGAVSQHLKVLRDAGAVVVRKEGRFRFYRARKEALGQLAPYLERVWRSHLRDLKALAEAAEQNAPTESRRGPR